MDDEDLAGAVLGLAGGPANLTEVSACATRLRLVLADPGAVDRAAIGALPGVLMVLDRAGQLQVVLGARAWPVSQAITRRLAG